MFGETFLGSSSTTILKRNEVCNTPAFGFNDDELATRGVAAALVAVS
jgi:hypothetical protein